MGISTGLNPWNNSRVRVESVDARMDLKGEGQNGENKAFSGIDHQPC